LVAGHRQACYSCGYDDLDDSDDTDTEDDSDASSTSTNLTVKLNRNYSYHNITRTIVDGNSAVSSLQHSKSLSSLPLPLKNIDNNKNTNNPKNALQTKNKLSRARGFSESHSKPRVTFSLHPELICSEAEQEVTSATGHRKLTKRENVLVNSSVQCDDDITSDCKDDTETELETDADTTTDPYDTIPDEDSKSDTDSSSDTEEYYKTIKSTENVYSYAYKDSISPAALIQLENVSVVSEVSESVYDVLGAETSKMEAVSDSMSEREDMFFSISKGRRKYLKFHKYVGWDINSVAEDTNEEAHDPDHDTTSNVTDAKHSRLLPLLLHEEKKQMIAENNQKPKFNSEDVRYYKYAQYKNVRTSKESESCHYSKSLI